MLTPNEALICIAFLAVCAAVSWQYINPPDDGAGPGEAPVTLFDAATRGT